MQHLVDANRVFADQIRNADQKAAYIFSFILALMVWSADARRAFSWRSLGAVEPATMLVSIVLSLAILISLFSALCVVLPRSRPGTSVLFWGAWPAAGERLAAARTADDRVFLFEDYMQNTRTLAAICAAKYRLVFLSFRALIVAVSAYAALLMLA